MPFNTCIIVFDMQVINIRTPTAIRHRRPGLTERLMRMACIRLTFGSDM
jgi:hypothetical protein